jgi:hypothetical protein
MTIEPPNFRARNTDPGTSKESAVAIAPKLGRMHERVMTIVKTYPYSTASEIDMYLGTHACSHKRLPELERRGLVKTTPEPRKCSKTGRNARVWYAPVKR